MSERIAVLISGEYRTFDIAVKTWNWLHELDEVDVYVSTWDYCAKTKQHINQSFFVKAFRSPIKVCINCPQMLQLTQPFYPQFPQFTNTIKMVTLWKKGIELIEQSGIHYDKMVLIRPDCKFVNTTILNHLSNAQPSIIYTSWQSDDNKFSDVMWLGEYVCIKGAIQSLDLVAFEKKPYHVHDWLFDSIKSSSVTLRDCYLELIRI